MAIPLKQHIQRNFRYKLLLLVLFPILLVIPLTLALAIYWSNAFTYEQLLMKVTTDLAVANDIFERIQQDYIQRLGNLGESHSFRESYESSDWTAIVRKLRSLRARGHFDFLHLIDANGQWLFEPTFGSGRTSKYSPMMSRALAGLPIVGIEIFTQEDLRRESLQLAEKVRLKLVPTPYAYPSNRAIEDRAMVIRAIYPIRDDAGNVMALLDGGILLNGNFEFVDAIRNLVYGRGSLPEDSWGTVTVFLDDVRISANVPHQQHERALGTRASEAVRNKVLQQGGVWTDRAFVVNDLYISAYEPIHDVDGQRVGMLHTGYLEAPFRNARNQALAALVVMFLLVITLSTWVAIRGAKTLFQPIEAMAGVVRATQAGEEKRIGSVASQDEIGELARQFDQMLDLLQERKQQLQHAADELETKVEERTHELKEKNIRLQKTINLLQQTRQRLVTAEKLAALGELTAGIAHEINNPTAVILGNMDVLIYELKEQAEPVRTEIDLIIEQIYRIRAIIDKLLQYSRPTEYAGYVQPLDVNEVIEDTLILVKHEIENQGAVVIKNLQASVSVTINRQELQQVLVNTLVNAAHAIDRKGLITIETADWSGEGVVIRVCDNGEGIPADSLSRIFDPFYSTKHQGTGLGLSVSYGLIRRYGGDITVESEVGKGSCFEILLRCEPVLIEDNEALMEFYAQAMQARQVS